MTEIELADRAAELRAAFDRSFVAAPSGRREEHEALLGIRVAGTSYAVRLGEIATLLVDRRIVPVPSAAPSLLGLAGVRGKIAPVFGLRSILGHSPVAESPRWIVLARATLVGFAFEEFDGHLRASPADIVPAPSHAGHAHVREVVRSRQALLPVVNLASVIDRLSQESR